MRLLKCQMGKLSIALGYIGGAIGSQRERRAKTILSLRASVAAASFMSRVGSYCAVQPPSTGMLAPVMERADDVHRNTVNAPISSVVTNRRVGCA